MAKYTKREAKKGTFKWKAKKDISMFTVDGEMPFCFIEGIVYNMEVVNMNMYSTESEYQDNHPVTKEFLHRYFEEVNE